MALGLKAEQLPGEPSAHPGLAAGIRAGIREGAKLPRAGQSAEPLFEKQ